MKIRYFSISAGLALLTASAIAFAPADGLTVRRRPIAGQVNKLRLKASIEFAGHLANFTGVEEDKITNIEADGSYTEESQNGAIEVESEGRTASVPAGDKNYTTFNAEGSVKEVRSETGPVPPELYRMQNLSVLIDPGRPLAVGDSWSVEIKSNDKTGARAARAEYTILGEETMCDTDTLKVRATIKETEGVEPSASESTLWISTLDGSEVKIESRLVRCWLPGVPASVNGVLTETRED
jgi:hypothetical protein